MAKRREANVNTNVFGRGESSNIYVSSDTRAAYLASFNSDQTARSIVGVSRSGKYTPFATHDTVNEITERKRLRRSYISSAGLCR